MGSADGVVILWQAEEAKAIIPSLREEGKIDNDVLNGLLMELTTFAK